MDDPIRWVVGAVALILIAGLLVWARGAEHHHGTYVGSVPAHSRGLVERGV